MRFLVNRLLVTSLVCVGIASGIAGCGDKKTDGKAGDSTATTSGTPAGGSEQEKNKEISRQFIDEVFNKGNMAFLEEHVAPDFVEHTPPPGGIEPGIAGFKKMIGDWRTGMPDMKIEVMNVIAEGDMVVIHSKQSGTHSGPMMGMPATNKKIADIAGLDLVRIKDGKMVEHWGYIEEAKMMTQLGMMPPMDGAKPPAAGGGTDTAAAASGGSATDTLKK